MHLFSYPSPGARVMPARTGGSGLGFVVAGLTQPREIWWERAKKEASEVGAGATVNGAAPAVEAEGEQQPSNGVAASWKLQAITPAKISLHSLGSSC